MQGRGEWSKAQQQGLGCGCPQLMMARCASTYLNSSLEHHGLSACCRMPVRRSFPHMDLNAGKKTACLGQIQLH